MQNLNYCKITKIAHLKSAETWGDYLRQALPAALGTIGGAGLGAYATAKDPWMMPTIPIGAMLGMAGGSGIGNMWKEVAKEKREKERQDARLEELQGIAGLSAEQLQALEGLSKSGSSVRITTLSKIIPSCGCPSGPDGYKEGTEGNNCATCNHFTEKGACEKFNVPVEGGMTCNSFEPRGDTGD